MQVILFEKWPRITQQSFSKVFQWLCVESSVESDVEIRHRSNHRAMGFTGQSIPSLGRVPIEMAPNVFTIVLFKKQYGGGARQCISISPKNL